MTYHYRDEYSAIFNTEVESYSNIGDHKRENTYFTTVKMSTYLIAILVSPFNVEGKAVSTSGVGVRILGESSNMANRWFSGYKLYLIMLTNKQRKDLRGYVAQDVN